MYLTAQRVVSDRGDGGINAFLHSHEGESDVSFSHPDLDVIAVSRPGRLEAELVEVTPGNNSVLSYLDIAASDSTAPTEFSDALEEFGSELASGACLRGDPYPVRTTSRGFAIEFYCGPQILQDALEEFETLKAHVLQLQRTRPAPRWLVERPLIVEADVGENSIRLVLSEESTRQVQRRHLKRWIPRSITVDHETRFQFERIHGDVLEHVVPVLTGLSLESIVDLGGIKVVDGGTGNVLAEWPQRE